MKKHAPSLKVLMYEGWNKLKIAQPLLAKAKMEVGKTGTKGKGKGRGRGKAAANDSAGISRSTSVSESSSASNSRSKRKAPDDDDAEDPPALNESAQTSWRTYIQQFDVILTTYQTLQSELVVARKPVKRPRREGAMYMNTLRPRSPLVMVEYVAPFPGLTLVRIFVNFALL
jgi:E3 ubiquitin-protein ligase SHPRH